MARPLGWGMIGAGVIAPTHAKAVQANPGGATIVGVCDTDQEKATAFAEAYGATFTTSSLDALLARDDIDIVSVCTPSGMHADCVIAAARAGKHILCEKPLDITREKMDAAIAAVREAGVKLGCVFQSRTNPLNRKVREMVQAGEFGQLLLADLSGKDYRAPDYYRTADWRGTIALDRGCLMNQGVHSMDLFLWLVGQPVVEVAGFWDHLARDIEAEDTIVGSLRFANGALGSVVYATSLSQKGLGSRIGIHSTEGNIVLAGKEQTLIERRGEELRLDGDADVAPHGQMAPATGHAEHVRDLIEAIQMDRDPAITGESARTAIDVILALYEASDRRTVVKLGR